MAARDKDSAEDPPSEGGAFSEEIRSPEEIRRAEQAEDLAEAVEAVAPPSHYVAREPLFIGGEEAMPARAFNAGDRVLPADVERFGWQDRVDRPEAEPAPKPPRVPAKDTAKSPTGRKQEE